MTYEILDAEQRVYTEALFKAPDRDARDVVRAELRPDHPAVPYAPLTNVGLFDLVRDNEWEKGYDAGSGLRRREQRIDPEPYAVHTLRERLGLNGPRVVLPA